jgi:hypothetical protein
VPAEALLERVAGRAERLRERLGLSHSSYSKLLARLGNAGGEVMTRGLEALKAVGRELAQHTALRDGSGDD